MDLAKPYSAISPSLDVEILVELSRSTKRRSGREVARRIGRSWGGVRPVLERLTEHGLVLRERAGSAYVYELNRGHLFATAVGEIAGARTAFVDRLRESIGSWEVRPLHASIFGSMARGDGSAGSDIDIFVVRPRELSLDAPAWRSQMEKLSDDVREWTGNDASIIEVGENEMSVLRGEGRPVLREIGADAIDLAGEPARKLVRA